MALEMFGMMFIVVVVLIVLSLQVLPSLAYTSFVFGDSLVDAGNNDYLFTLSKADSPPYGIDFSPSGGQPTGRFTNGRTIADILDEALGAKSFPLPYLAPTPKPDAFLRGLNYASGSSGILDKTGTFFIQRIPLRQQVDYFEESRSHMVTMIGEKPTMELLKKAMFSITTGSNDVLNHILPLIPFSEVDKISSAMLQDFMVSNLTRQIQMSLVEFSNSKSHAKRLHKLGARKFIVVGVGPLGCIPIVRTMNLLPSGHCAIELNELVQGYNKKLNRVLDRLNQEMQPETIFVYANSYDIVMGIIQNYHEYGTSLGFVNAEDPCCGGNFPPFICFKGTNSNTSSVLCDDRSKFVFWDAFHPTEAANIIMARKLLNGDESISYPINIIKLYNYKP